MLNKMKFIEKLKNKKTKIKLIIILAVEFIAVLTILLLVLFAGKKSYTVTFDLNGGTLISGEVEQRVVQGQNASPPSVAKYGHYLRGWSGSYKSVTRNVTVKAIWEYNTSPGIEYEVIDHRNYCEISGSYRDIQGDVYIGAYYEDRQVMGIKEGAFKDRVGIKGVYLLDGILGIADEAFSGCTSLEVIELPSTLIRIGKEAFKGCESLKEIILPASLQFIDESAFEGCTSLEKLTFYEEKPDESSDKPGKGDKDSTTQNLVKSKIESIGSFAFKGCESLTEITLPMSLKIIGESAFEDCIALEKVTFSDDNSREFLEDLDTDGEEKLTLNSKLETIGSLAFKGCESLTEITLPLSAIKIGEGVFDTPEMTVKLYYTEEELPETFDALWVSDEVVLIYDLVNYVEPPKEDDPEMGEEEDADGENTDEVEEDHKNFWEGLSL